MVEESAEERMARLGKLLIEYTRKNSNPAKALRTLEKLKKVRFVALGRMLVMTSLVIRLLRAV